jgi:hypothetical protein
MRKYPPCRSPRASLLFILLQLLLSLADGTMYPYNVTNATSESSNSEYEGQPDDDDDQFLIKDVYRPQSYVFVIIGMALLALCYCYIQNDKHHHDAILYNRSLQSEDATSECGQSQIQVVLRVVAAETSSHVPENIHVDGDIVSELELPSVQHPKPKVV